MTGHQKYIKLSLQLQLPAILKNLFKTAWRNLLRNKAFSFINLFGLILGMGCSLLIFLWVQDGRSMDAFHTKSADIYGRCNMFHGTFKNGYPERGRIQYVRLFTIVAIFILVIACINFMNLSTARSVKGQRKWASARPSGQVGSDSLVNSSAKRC